MFELTEKDISNVEVQCIGIVFYNKLSWFVSELPKKRMLFVKKWYGGQCFATKWPSLERSKCSEYFSGNSNTNHSSLLKLCAKYVSCIEVNSSACCSIAPAQLSMNIDVRVERFCALATSSKTVFVATKFIFFWHVHWQIKVSWRCFSCIVKSFFITFTQL